MLAAARRDIVMRRIVRKPVFDDHCFGFLVGLKFVDGFEGFSGFSLDVIGHFIVLFA